MIRLVLSFAGVLLLCTLNAQQTTLNVDGRALKGARINDEEAWFFQDEKDTIIAVSFSAYNELVKKARQQEAEAQRLREILAAKEELITRFKTYELAANEHIDVQKQLIHTADSLYTGYKGLYRDLKEIYNLSTFSLIPGVGFYTLPDQNGIIGSLGVGYKDIQGHVQVGNDYKGLLIGYRIPLF